MKSPVIIQFLAVLVFSLQYLCDDTPKRRVFCVVGNNSQVDQEEKHYPDLWETYRQPMSAATTAVPFVSHQFDDGPLVTYRKLQKIHGIYIAINAGTVQAEVAMT